jgi:hypothetical protein
MVYRNAEIASFSDYWHVKRFSKKLKSAKLSKEEINTNDKHLDIRWNIFASTIYLYLFWIT